jgi:hypothetical protein
MPDGIRAATWLIALRFSGRFRVIVAIRFETAKVTCSVLLSHLLFIAYA